MSAREMGIGFEHRDLRSGLAELLSHILREDTRRFHVGRNREILRLNRLAEFYGVNEIVLAFIIFVKRYGRRAKNPFALFIRKFDWCSATGYSTVLRDEEKATGWTCPEGVRLSTVGEWVYFWLEDHHLLGFTHLVADYPRWGQELLQNREPDEIAVRVSLSEQVKPKPAAVAEMAA